MTRPIHALESEQLREAVKGNLSIYFHNIHGTQIFYTSSTKN